MAIMSITNKRTSTSLLVLLRLLLTDDITRNFALQVLSLFSCLFVSTTHYTLSYAKATDPPTFSLIGTSKGSSYDLIHHVKARQDVYANVYTHVMLALILFNVLLLFIVVMFRSSYLFIPLLQSDSYSINKIVCYRIFSLSWFQEMLSILVSNMVRQLLTLYCSL